MSMRRACRCALLAAVVVLWVLAQPSRADCDMPVLVTKSTTINAGPADLAPYGGLHFSDMSFGAGEAGMPFVYTIPLRQLRPGRNLVTITNSKVAENCQLWFVGWDSVETTTVTSLRIVISDVYARGPLSFRLAFPANTTILLERVTFAPRSGLVNGYAQGVELYTVTATQTSFVLRDCNAIFGKPDVTAVFALILINGFARFVENSVFAIVRLNVPLSALLEMVVYSLPNSDEVFLERSAMLIDGGTLVASKHILLLSRAVLRRNSTLRFIGAVVKVTGRSEIVMLPEMEVSSASTVTFASLAVSAESSSIALLSAGNTNSNSWRVNGPGAVVAVVECSLASTPLASPRIGITVQNSSGPYLPNVVARCITNATSVLDVSDFVLAFSVSLAKLTTLPCGACRVAVDCDAASALDVAASEAPDAGGACRCSCNAAGLPSPSVSASAVAFCLPAPGERRHFVLDGGTLAGNISFGAGLSSVVLRNVSVSSGVCVSVRVAEMTPDADAGAWTPPLSFVVEQSALGMSSLLLLLGLNSSQSSDWASGFIEPLRAPTMARLRVRVMGLVSDGGFGVFGSFPPRSDIAVVDSTFQPQGRVLYDDFPFGNSIYRTGALVSAVALDGESTLRFDGCEFAGTGLFNRAPLIIGQLNITDRSAFLVTNSTFTREPQNFAIYALDTVSVADASLFELRDLSLDATAVVTYWAGTLSLRVTNASAFRFVRVKCLTSVNPYQRLALFSGVVTISGRSLALFRGLAMNSFNGTLVDMRASGSRLVIESALVLDASSNAASRTSTFASISLIRSSSNFVVRCNAIAGTAITEYNSSLGFSLMYPDRVLTCSQCSKESDCFEHYTAKVRTRGFACGCECDHSTFIPLVWSVDAAYAAECLIAPINYSAIESGAPLPPPPPPPPPTGSHTRSASGSTSASGSASRSAPTLSRTRSRSATTLSVSQALASETRSASRRTSADASASSSPSFSATRSTSPSRAASASSDVTATPTPTRAPIATETHAETKSPSVAAAATATALTSASRSPSKRGASPTTTRSGASATGGPSSATRTLGAATATPSPSACCACGGSDGSGLRVVPFAAVSRLFNASGGSALPSATAFVAEYAAGVRDGGGFAVRVLGCWRVDAAAVVEPPRAHFTAAVEDDASDADVSRGARRVIRLRAHTAYASTSEQRFVVAVNASCCEGRVAAAVSPLLLEFIVKATAPTLLPLQAARAVAAAASAIAVASANPTVAVNAARVTALQRFVVCQASTADDTFSLFGIGFGPASGRFLRGAVVGNLCVAVGGFAAVGLAVALVLGRGDRAAVRAALARRLHLPSALVLPFSVALQPTLAACITLLTEPTDGGAGDVVLAVAGAGCCLAFVGYVQWQLVLRPAFPLVLVPARPPKRGGPEGAPPPPPPLWTRLRRYLFRKPRRWASRLAPRRDGGDAVAAASPESLRAAAREVRWKRRHLLLVADFAVPRYFAFDTAASVVVGAASGVVTREAGGCQAQLAVLCGVYAALLLASLLRPPMLGRFDGAYVVMVNACGLLAAVLLIAASSTATRGGGDDGDAAGDSASLIEASASLALMVSFVSTFKGAVDIAALVAYARRRLRLAGLGVSQLRARAFQRGARLLRQLRRPRKGDDSDSAADGAAAAVLMPPQEGIRDDERDDEDYDDEDELVANAVAAVAEAAPAADGVGDPDAALAAAVCAASGGGNGGAEPVNSDGLGAPLLLAPDGDAAAPLQAIGGDGVDGGGGGDGVEMSDLLLLPLQPTKGKDDDGDSDDDDGGGLQRNPLLQL